jgi:hypothetical protein
MSKEHWNHSRTDPMAWNWDSLSNKNCISQDSRETEPTGHTGLWGLKSLTIYSL